MANVIEELKLNLGSKKVSLTVDEAKKLKKALNDLFGKEVVRKVVKDPYWPYPYWYWYTGYCDYGDKSIGITYADSSQTQLVSSEGWQASYDANNNVMSLTI